MIRTVMLRRLPSPLARLSRRLRVLRKCRRRQFGPRDRARSCLDLQILEERIVLAPVFTGNVPADFTAADAIVVQDPGGVGDVGIPDGTPAGTVSGWDVVAVYLDYDFMTDTMSVGIDCFGRVFGGLRLAGLRR